MFVNSSFPALSCSSGNSLDENQNIVLKDPSGVIKTPGYPSSDPVTQCYWKIFTPKGKVVRVDFSSFRLARGTCIYFVQTINKKNSIETPHCGQKPSFVVYSMTNELGIRIQELYSTGHGPGFIANYTTVTAGNNERLICLPSVHITRVDLQGTAGDVPLFVGKNSQTNCVQSEFFIHVVGGGALCSASISSNFVHNTSLWVIHPCLSYELEDF